MLDEVERPSSASASALTLVLAGILAKGHVLLEDFPGLGKTLAARSFAQALGPGLRAGAVHPRPAAGRPHRVVRLRPAARRSSTSGRGPLFTGLLLADEINRTPPKTQSALLEAMQERQVTVEGETFPLPSPFHVLATANPIEYEGTYPLPEAQLDRFLLRVALRLPDRRRGVRRARAAGWTAGTRRSTSTRSPTPPGWLPCRRRSRRSRSTRRVGRYCVDLAAATRDAPRRADRRLAARLPRPGADRPRLGGDPRAATTSSPRTSRPWPAPVLAHRITVKPELWMTEASGARVVDAGARRRCRRPRTPRVAPR